MKKRFTLICLSFLLSNFLWAGEIITLDLSNPTKPSKINLDAEKGYWNETYNTSEEYRQLQFDLFSFTHNMNGFGGTDVGGGMSYWDGFTYCTSGDITDYGEYGSSDAWVAQQWGCMAGGGIKTGINGNVVKDENGKVQVEKGLPYLVAYWGYWIELMDGGAPCLQVNFTDRNAYKPLGIYINNHPWPYYGNIHGDGFASPFIEEGQFFKLTIHGMNENGEDIGITVDHTLAEFKNGELHQSTDWEWIDLSPLGSVYGIYFTMDTSDADPIYGPNTAVYFCLDKLQVESLDGDVVTPSRPTGLIANPTETSIAFSWTASNGSVKGYNIYLDGTFKTFVTSTQYTFDGLLPYTQHQLTVEAVGTDNSVSDKAVLAASTTDETVPTSPTNLEGIATDYTIALSWDASSDNVGVTEYHVYLNGERQKRVTTTAYTLTGLDPATSYLVEVEARDAAGNRSQKAQLQINTSSMSTNIENELGQTQINVSHDIIHIENATQGVLNIYDLRGTRILTREITTENSNINISSLAKGIYIIKYNDITQKISK